MLTPFTVATFDLSKLTREDVTAALENQGYTGGGIISATFKQITEATATPHAAYTVKYADGVTNGTGTVFVYLNRAGKLVAEW